MSKLLGMYLKYSLLPEKEFTVRASKRIYELAELAEGHKKIGIRSQPDSLKISLKDKHIDI